MPVKPIPEGFHSLTPFLTVFGADKVLDFMKQAFGADIKSVMKMPDGTVAHATAKIGDSMVMLGEANDRWKAMPASIYVYVPDVDGTYKKALEAGGVSVSEVSDQFYGERHGGVKDPAGNIWWIATHIEDVSEEELKRRMASFRNKEV